MVEKKELAVTEEKVVEIEMERLRSFENHPFKVKADSQMMELQESVNKYLKHFQHRRMLKNVKKK